jgi:pyruvate-formate lyase-activating enzyme
VETQAVEPPFLSNIGIMLTYKCTIACPHCIVEAGPHRKEEMKLDDAFNWIEQASHYRNGHIKGLALTGGECFYDLDKLSKLSEFSKSLGFTVSVVTNAFWASTKEDALRTLSSLPAIQIISLSTDVYHQRFIPFEFIQNAIWAARKLGRTYNIAVCTDNEEDPHFQKIIEELNSIGEQDRIRLSITFPVGRALRRARYFHYHTSSVPTISACSMAGSPVVFPDGKVIGCIGPLITLPPGHPLFLGNLQDKTLVDILDMAELNPILHTIRIWGPQKLVCILQDYGLSHLLPTEYIDNCICDACFKLLSSDKIINALVNILQNQDFQKTLAYARLYYLNEYTMLENFSMEATEIPH